ncbi:hypothetical protein IT774_10255 [Salinimonas marina]|uniref:Uncharacterized protein n=1 Tax=Salinimonas marina TaxID=2785918 RepID=A0A7S9DWN9_9ALTE|nr:hypothetical protein [Salinimonas marina]QPG04615.1 hypothetical protein IT774_10255 [Salinimonas marina]
MKPAYPYFKVIICFLMCPLLSGIILFSISDFYSFFSENTPTLFHEHGLTGLWIYIVYGIYGLIFFCIPAGLLAGLYAYLNLYRQLTSYVWVFLLGGAGAYLWAYALIRMTGKDISLSNTADFSNYQNLVVFALGALSSIFMAYLVLPKKPRSKHNQKK